MKIKRIPEGERVFKGFYDYSVGARSYSKEEFEVYHSSQGSTMSFFSSIYTRMTTGEMLHIYVDYMVSKDFLPYRIMVEKTLGKNRSSEIYQYDKTKNLVNYFFATDEEEKHVNVAVASRFHIATPAAVSSMFFVQNCREGSGEQTFCTLLTGQNKWVFESEPVLKSVILYKPREKMEPVKIGMETVYAHVYRLYENTEGGNLNSPHLNVYMSQHFNIPYMFRSPEGTSVWIKKWEYTTRN